MYIFNPRLEEHVQFSSIQFSQVQFSSVAQSCPTLCDPMNRSTPGLPVHHQLPEFTQTHVHRVSDAIQPSHPLLSPSLLPPIPPSIRVFSSESALRIRWLKYWSFSFNISPSNEHPGWTILEIWANLNMIVFSNSIILESILNCIIILCPCSSKHLHICLGEKKHNVCNSPQILPALVHMGCCTIMQQTGWLINDRKVFLTVLATRSPRSLCMSKGGPSSGLSGLSTSLYPQRGKGSRELCWREGGGGIF